MANDANVLNTKQMVEKYGEFYESANKLSLDREKIPDNLWVLTPYAELWGVSDDLYREELVGKAPRGAIDDLRNAIEQFEDELDDWLAGDEADSDSPSGEYVAFSAMRMAADFA